MTCRLFLAAVVVATTSALVPPTRPLQRAGSLQPPSTRPIAAARPAATAIATAWIPTVALADFGTWISGLGTQDYVALGVLAFLVIFVIPSLVGDILENQADPAAAIAKKQQRLLERLSGAAMDASAKSELAKMQAEVSQSVVCCARAVHLAHTSLSAQATKRSDGEKGQQAR